MRCNLMKCLAAQRSWQSCNLRLTCSALSLTDLHAAAVRALFKPWGRAAVYSKVRNSTT